MHKVRQAPRAAPCTLLLLCQPSLASALPLNSPWDLTRVRAAPSHLDFHFSPKRKR